MPPTGTTTLTRTGKATSAEPRSEEADADSRRVRAWENARPFFYLLKEILRQAPERQRSHIVVASARV